MLKFSFILTCTLVLTSNVNAQQQLNMPLLGTWDDNTLPTSWAGTYNDCWGYAAPDGKEYAIMGGVLGTYFFNVTDPSNPLLVNFFRGNDTIAVHRDFKTYGHYAYGVCDQGNSSLQIFDLQYLPDSVAKVYDSNQFSIRAHNIFVSGDKLFLASNTTLSGFHALDVLSLADPINPVFISTLNHPQIWHVHDVFVRNDTAYCSAGNAGLFIYDYSNPTNPQLLQSITSYPEQGYNHSSWLSDDSRYLVFADEDHGKGLKIYDISDLNNPILKSVFRSNLLNVPNPTSPNGSIPHNPFIKGDKLFVSYYHDGVVVYDISNPTNTVQYAWYDTYPQNTDYVGYKGAWGVYPFLPSGNIIASDIDNGLFIFDGSLLTGVNSNTVQKNLFYVYPNPTETSIFISPLEDNADFIALQLFDAKGSVSFPQSYAFGEYVKVDLAEYPSGLYFVKIISSKSVQIEKLIIR